VIPLSDPLLFAESITAGYGEGIVLHDVGFSMNAGESLAVLGRNGVGKSTLLLTLLGHLPLRSGTIKLRGAEITRDLPNVRVEKGLGWVPQGRECFPSLTVDEHLVIAERKGPWNRERVYGLFPRLKERIKNMGNQLSGGEQQMLAIGRALMTNPAILILDEPLEGLAPVIVAEVSNCLRALVRDEGTTLILVEQRASFALELTANALVLERGRISYAGTSAALAADEVLLDRVIGMRKLHETKAELAADVAAAADHP
jgi:branched-chain amino acid transport system ATP-binding protein